MAGDAREADKTRRRAEALRANLKRRKAASAGQMPPATQDEGARAEPKTSDREGRGD